MSLTLITGATSGIGLELAKLFAADKHDLFLVARSVHDELDQLSTSLEKEYGVTVRTMALDLSQPGAVDKLWQTTEKEKLQVDVLVNNAGFGLLGPFMKTDWNREAQMIQLNIVTLTQLCKRYVPGMVERHHGRVLNLASVASFLPGPFMNIYYATKAYVLSFSIALNDELRGTGVTVTALCPGATQTKFAITALADHVPLFKGQLASPQIVAQVGYQACLQGKPLAIVSRRNQMMVAMSRLLPLPLAARLVRLTQQA